MPVCTDGFYTNDDLSNHVHLTKYKTAACAAVVVNMKLFI